MQRALSFSALTMRTRARLLHCWKLLRSLRALRQYTCIALRRALLPALWLQRQLVCCWAPTNVRTMRRRFNALSPLSTRSLEGSMTRMCTSATATPPRPLATTTSTRNATTTLYQVRCDPRFWRPRRVLLLQRRTFGVTYRVVHRFGASRLSTLLFKCWRVRWRLLSMKK
jgi:hypothetical protein